VQAFLDLAGSGNFGDSTVNGDTVFPSVYNLRNHRLDVISFFARGRFSRQTGNPDTFVDGMSAQEAWIWYGHLHLPVNNASGNMVNDYPHDPTGVGGTPDTFPCQGNSSTNPNNYFGSKLVLGRVAIVLKQPNTAGQVVDNQGVAQWYLPASFAGALDPLAYSTKVNPIAMSSSEYPSGYQLPDSRVDVAGTTIAGFRTILNAYTSASPSWYDAMMDGNPGSTASAGPYYTRFKCNPLVSKPMTSRDMAQASPYFIGGCSQFMVEFAGDFLTQDRDPSHLIVLGAPRTNYGDVQAYAPDGEIDFTVTYPSGTGSPPVKQIKWYGMPRGTSGNNAIRGPLSGGAPGTDQADVVPLRDWVQNMKKSDGTAANPASLSNAPFEKNYPNILTFQKGDYKLNMSLGEAQNGYTCAFGPTDPHPKLIRITITLDDPTGRLPEGQTYQYVYALP
jgi:hypothetical protein